MAIQTDYKVIYETIEPRDFLPPIVRLTNVIEYPIWRHFRFEAPQAFNLIRYDMRSMGEFLTITEEDLNEKMHKENWKKFRGFGTSDYMHRSRLKRDENWLIQYFISGDKNMLYAVWHNGNFDLIEAWVKVGREKKRYLSIDDFKSLETQMKPFGLKLGSRLFTPDIGKLTEHYYNDGLNMQAELIFE